MRIADTHTLMLVWLRRLDVRGSLECSANHLLPGQWWLVGVVDWRLVDVVWQWHSHFDTHMFKSSTFLWRCDVLWRHIDHSKQLLYQCC